MLSLPTLTGSSRSSDRGRAARIWLLLNRRWLAALCAAVCAWSALQVISPSPPPGTAVSVAARDLPAGRVLRPSDLRAVVLPEAAVPAGVDGAPEGRTLSGPMRSGEVVTDARVLSAALPDHLDGLAGVPVRIDDVAVVSLLRVGDRVDLVAVDPRGAGHRSVAHNALVVGLPDAGAATSGLVGGNPTSGALVVLGVARETADELAAAAADETLQIVFRGGLRPDP